MHLVPIAPLSINKAFCGRRFLTKEAKKYISDVLLLLPNRTGLKFGKEDKLRLTLHFGFSNTNSDVSNAIKIFEDCLMKKIGTINDRQIYELHVLKIITEKKKEYIEFLLEEI